MRYFVIGLLFILTAVSAFAKDKVIKVGIQQNFPPYEFSSNNRIIGFNIDILHQLSDLFSYEFEFIQSNHDSLKAMLRDGELDFISFCFQSQTNKAEFSLSIPYNMVPYGIFVPYDSPIETPQDILTSTLSIENEQIYNMLLQNNNFSGTLNLNKSHTECLEEVLARKTDAAIVASLTGKYLVEKHSYKEIQIPPINFRNLQYSCAFPKTGDSLLVQFNEGLNILRETGTYNRIYQKWFGEIHPNQVTEVQKVVLWPFYLMGALIVILVVMFVIQRKRYLALKDLKEKEIMIRHHAEKSLFEYRNAVNGIIDHLPHIIFLKDKNNKFILANKALAQLLGTSKEILLQNSSESVQLNVNMGHLIDYNNNSDELNSQKIQLIDATSQLRSFEVTRRKFVRPMSSDQILMVVAIDISRREKYEQLLKNEKALLSSLIKSIPDLIFYKNTQLEYLGGNTAFKDFNNFQGDQDFIGKVDHELFDKQTADQYLEADNEIIKNRTKIQFNRWETSPNGDKFLYDTQKVPIIDKTDKLIGIVGISRNITKQATIKQQLERAKSKAEQSDKLKTLFLTNLSHEIRTPLNSIIGFSDLLTDPDLTDDQREEFTELISKSGGSLLGLVDDIIDLSKIEAKQVQINKSKFDLSRMIMDIYESIEDSRDQIQKRSVHVEYYIPGSEEQPFYIVNDEFRIKQVLINLIKNALKYTTKGEVKFGFDIENSQVRFFIKDTGLGIPQDQQSSIFERYDRVHSFESFGGSGLGLSISKKLVELLDGNIDFKTDELEGSEFFFTIPLDEESQKQQSEQSEAGREYNWDNITILVAEDEQNNFMFLQETLKKTGAEIIWATDGNEAVKAVNNNPNINIILMDIRMPNMDGYQATKEIKKIRNDLPIIAQTAYAMSDERDLSLQAGCDEYMTKPIRPKKLLKKINQLLS
jgi:signal transduction histidine kinase/CheY-like chemotaxis protein/ABC-type amino acid transport substrate-binding protein